MTAFRLNDENTLEDILGAVYVAQGLGRAPAAERNLEYYRGAVIMRLEEKLVRTKNRTRRAWFTRALESARRAFDFYEAGELDQGEKQLQQPAQSPVSG